MSESQFAGCHGVRVEPASQGAAFGVTSGSPLAMLALGEGPDPGAVALAGGRALWRAETAAPDGRPVANAMWCTPDRALVTVVDDHPVLWISETRDATTVAPLGEALVLQLVSTYAAPLAAQRAGAFVLHAAAAVRDGRALVVCAHSGTGKSSVMTALERGPALFGHAVALTRRVPVSRLRLQRSPGWRAEAVAMLGALAG